MKIRRASIALFALMCASGVSAQELKVPMSGISTRLDDRGDPVENSAVSFRASEFQGIDGNLPTQQISKIVQTPFSEVTTLSRSAKDVQIYRTVAPSVVLIVTKDSLGSGSLISSSGDIITNWHVVKGYSDVAVVFKPIVEQQEWSKEDIRVGHVAKYDEIADLALVKVSDAPRGREPVRLGDSGEISVGVDVHAIGHPTGEAWTYTKGVISQYRLGFEWGTKDDNARHKADVVQTQTPINPGNSGGPLISDSAKLIGVNSFKSSGEGLNFAVSVDDVRRFLSRPDSRFAQQKKTKSQAKACEPREVFKSRNKTNDATIISYDTNCRGKANAEFVYPDDTAEPLLLKLDRNGDGRADVIYFDLRRRGKWDMSWWDENFDGHWTLVGYHDDGSLTPTRFESYDAYQRRLAKR